MQSTKQTNEKNILKQDNYNQIQLKPINLLGGLIIFIGIVVFILGESIKLYGLIILLRGIYLLFRISKIFKNNIIQNDKKNTLKNIIRNTGILFIIIGTIAILLYLVLKNYFYDSVIGLFIFFIGLIAIILKNRIAISYLKMAQKLTPYKFGIYSLIIGLISLTPAVLFPPFIPFYFLTMPAPLFINGFGVYLAIKQKKIKQIKILTITATITNLIPIILRLLMAMYSIIGGLYIFF